MVVAEECHHYATDLSWGKALESLPYSIMLGLSATPFRSQGDHLFSTLIKIETEKSREKVVWWDKSRVVYCTITEALLEGAIRPLIVVKGKYQVEFKEPDDTRHAFLLSELKNYLYEHNLELSEFEAKKELRVLDQFVRPLFMEALDLLQELDRNHPGQHQMIVHAPSVLLAKTYCKWFNMLSDTTSGPAAYWIGSGAEQADAQNKEITDNFKANKFPVLVQVQMFGEGSDNVRASVGLWLSLIGSNNPSCHQGMVRHTRRNLAIPQNEDVAYLLIPEDSPGFDRAKAIEAENEYCVASGVLDLDEDGKAPVQLKLPTLEELERTLRATASELLGVETSDNYAAKVAQIKEELQQDGNILRAAAKSGTTKEEVEAVLSSIADELVRRSIATVENEISEHQARDEWSRKVESAVKQIARYVAQKNHPVAVESSTFNATVGSLKKKLNTILKNKVGNGIKRDFLEVSDLKRQYDYLSGLAAQVNDGKIPPEINL
jgi:superfamily II DNA or RNA helicase